MREFSVHCSNVYSLWRFADGPGSSQVICAAVLLLAAVAETPPESSQTAAHVGFSEALALAKADLATPEGHAYDRVLSAFLREQNGAVLTACFKSTPAPDKGPFELVFQVERRGGVVDAIVWPETNIGVCLKDGLKAKTFPAPPRDSYWAHQRMSFGR